MLDRIESCSFKREENSEWEHGLLLNDGDLGILDMNGKIPEDVWDYNTEGTLVISNISKIFD